MMMIIIYLDFYKKICEDLETLISENPHTIQKLTHRCNALLYTVPTGPVSQASVSEQLRKKEENELKPYSQTLQNSKKGHRNYRHRCHVLREIYRKFGRVSSVKRTSLYLKSRARPVERHTSIIHSQNNSGRPPNYRIRTTEINSKAQIQIIQIHIHL